MAISATLSIIEAINKPDIVDLLIAELAKSGVDAKRASALEIEKAFVVISKESK